MKSEIMLETREILHCVVVVSGGGSLSMSLIMYWTMSPRERGNGSTAGRPFQLDLALL